jgi:hypothetical protein
MEISGQCFCGAIEYIATIDESRVGICHCRDCQIFSGSAFRTVGVVTQPDFRFTKGEPKVFSKVADSGKTRRMAFCGDCGTHLCSLPDEGESDAYVSVRIATAREFARLKPMVEIFCDSRAAWLPPLQATVQFPRMPTVPRV